MRISDIYTAKGYKFKLTYLDDPAGFSVGALLNIEPAQRDKEFLVKQYGTGCDPDENKIVICKAGKHDSDYLTDLLETQKINALRCLFSVEGVNDSSLEVQAYTFGSAVEYKTPIDIQVPDALLDKTTPEKLYREYVWTEYGEPALFCLNYKNKKKQEAELRFLSGKRYLRADNTPRGIVAISENYLKDRYTPPVDIYFAPEIRFIAETDVPHVNDDLAQNLDKVSNPSSYFARWEAYNELSKKLLEQECEEFGKLHYFAVKEKADLNGMTFEFETDEEPDESFKGKELCVTPTADADDDEEHRVRPVAVGEIKNISRNKITTYLSVTNGWEYIPETGDLSLYVAGDKIIAKRRDAARERMMKNQSPIKSIVALIEAGASTYELSGGWGGHKAVTEELMRNFKKAAALNPEQIEALSVAVNTPDIAIIQGPPGTGKTTVIKAICERFREIFEAEERKAQKADPEHALRSPKILISSFQNEAVDNAISAPLPGDIPAYRKTAKRAKDSTKEQYQKALDDWYAGVRRSIGELIVDKAAKEFVESKKKLDDEYFSYKNSGESLELASALIRHYLTFTEIAYPRELVDAADAVIKAAAGEDFDDIPDPIVAKLESQRTDREAFNDDGPINVQRLLAHIRIRDDLTIEESDIENIAKAGNPDITDEDFRAYVSTVTKLQKQLCIVKTRVNTKDKGLVNECLLALHECFANQYMNTLSDIESKKSLILSEFLSRLEQEYEAVVKKYSMTTAATCQTCFDLHDEFQVFDLVVIDEAARANPLDLFIPMSMGKRIVLVGDHKQLPHMLEPDVLKLIMDDPKFKDLPEIERSLFERLFEMFSKGQNPKAIRLTRQFRMHPEICKFVSESFYDGQLKTSEKIKPEDRSSPAAINEGKPLTFVNVPITRGAETPGISKSRKAEADAIARDLKTILEIDKEASVGIITFYAAQASKIKQSIEMMLNAEEISRVEVGTVDAFQGKEFDYVMLSCVRSNRPKNAGEKPSVGFLEKPNRLCVAFSRAIRQLITYGDAETLMQIPCFDKLYNICISGNGGYYREY